MSSMHVGASYATLAGGATRFRPAERALAPRIADLVLTWFERARHRRQLGQLSNHMLKDIGLNRADVEIEAAKPFWRA